MGLVSDFLAGGASGEAKRVEGWLEENYSAFPSGIDGYGSRRYEDAVTVKLADPLDRDVFRAVVEEHGYDPVIDEESDSLWVGIYDVEGNPGGGQGKRLVGALSFEEGQEVALGSDPVRKNGDSNSYQLDYLNAYLEKKYA